MQFSIFTPTHKPDYLMETYKSLDGQTLDDWEWVIVPNGKGVLIPESIARDTRVRIIPAPDEVAEKGIGALKLFACNHCKGKYLLELDHDDLLTPEALEVIDKAARETGAGFLYSDFANFYPDGTCQIYNDANGWEHYPVHVDGKDYTAMSSFEVDASALHLIFFAPNHVRVWKRNAYQKVGGHDESLNVVDDHDLLCRTYMAGIEFHHIPQCLYLYRLLPGRQNTFLKNNQEIQQKQQQISNKYSYQLIREWCKRNDYPMIDLGGAHNCPPGYKSVDMQDADICANLMQGIPLPDDSVGCVRAYDFLEHIPHCRDSACAHGADGKSPLCTVGMMNEIYRVLAPGGWLVSRTPSTEGRGAFQDPTHVSFWNPNSFWYYTKEEQARYLRGVTCRFQGTRIWQTFPTDWHKEHNILYVYADLVALKGQRQPGICEI